MARATKKEESKSEVAADNTSKNSESADKSFDEKPKASKSDTPSKSDQWGDDIREQGNPESRASEQGNGERREEYRSRGYDRPGGYERSSEGFDRQRGGYDRYRGGYGRQEGFEGRRDYGSSRGYERSSESFDRRRGDGYDRPAPRGDYERSDDYNRPRGGYDRFRDDYSRRDNSEGFERRDDRFGPREGGRYDGGYRGDRFGPRDDYAPRKRMRPQMREDPAEPNETIGIFNLSYNLTPADFDEYLKEKLADFEGKYTTKLVLSAFTNRCRGYGFVHFDDIEDAIKAKGLLENGEIHGQQYRVAYSIQRQPRYNNGQMENREAKTVEETQENEN